MEYKPYTYDLSSMELHAIDLRFLSYLVSGMVIDWIEKPWKILQPMENKGGFNYGFLFSGEFLSQDLHFTSRFQ